MKEFFEKAAEALHLGKLMSDPAQVTGGLTHRMYRLETSCGIFAAKMLNPAIMQRPTALSNYARADELEELLKQHHIRAVYALDATGKSCSCWMAGTSMSMNGLTESLCSLAK